MRVLRVSHRRAVHVDTDYWKTLKGKMGAHARRCDTGGFEVAALGIPGIEERNYFSQSRSGA